MKALLILASLLFTQAAFAEPACDPASRLSGLETLELPSGAALEIIRGEDVKIAMDVLTEVNFMFGFLGNVDTIAVVTFGKHPFVNVVFGRDGCALHVAQGIPLPEYTRIRSMIEQRRDQAALSDRSAELIARTFREMSQRGGFGTIGR